MKISRKAHIGAAKFTEAKHRRGPGGKFAEGGTPQSGVPKKEARRGQDFLTPRGGPSKELRAALGHGPVARRSAAQKHAERADYYRHAMSIDKSPEGKKIWAARLQKHMAKLHKK